MKRNTRDWINWNVKLWLTSYEYAYYNCMHLIHTLGLKDATDRLYNELKGTRTPDGAPYTKYAIRHTLKGLI